MSQRDVNNLLPRLQRWYSAQCNGQWEHDYGVVIETLDNPGWLLRVNLVQTALEGIPFQVLSEGIGEYGEPRSDQWLHCRVIDHVWHGAGDSAKLPRLIEEFLVWAERDYRSKPNAH